MRSMVIAGLFRCEPVVREIPSADPGVLAISTTNGPEALATVSGMMGRRKKERIVENKHAHCPAWTSPAVLQPLLLRKGVA